MKGSDIDYNMLDYNMLAALMATACAVTSGLQNLRLLAAQGCLLLAADLRPQPLVRMADVRRPHAFFSYRAGYLKSGWSRLGLPPCATIKCSASAPPLCWCLLLASSQPQGPASTVASSRDVCWRHLRRVWAFGMKHDGMGRNMWGVSPAANIYMRPPILAIGTAVAGCDSQVTATGVPHDTCVDISPTA